MAETSGRDLGDKGVAHGADGDVVDAREDEKERANRPLRARVALGDDAAEADDEQNAYHGQIAADVECAASDAGNECPGNEDADGADGVLA